MSIEGRIAVDVNFTDSATGAASSVKKIQLVDATAYTSGKVAVVTGTCGTAVVAINVNPSPYVGADGQAVSFTAGVTRVAFVVSGTNPRYITDGAFTMTLRSGGGRPCMADVGSTTNSFSIGPSGFLGTAAYTAVFYGT